MRAPPPSGWARLQGWGRALQGAAQHGNRALQIATRQRQPLKAQVGKPSMADGTLLLRRHASVDLARPGGSSALIHTTWTLSRSPAAPQGQQHSRSLSWLPGGGAESPGTAVEAVPGVAAQLDGGEDVVVAADGGLVEAVLEAAGEAPHKSLWQLVKSGSPEFWVNVTYAQESFFYVHQQTGLPWWATIVCVTVATRGALFPAFVYQQRVGQRLQKAIPLLQEVEREFLMARDVFKDPGAIQRKKSKSKAIYNEHRCHPWRLGVNMLLLGPIFGSYFFGIKGIVNVYPDMAAGGALWFSNLAVPDPFYALPFITAGSFLLVLELGARARQHAMPPLQFKMQIGVQRIACLSMFPLLVGLKYPAGVFLYWFTNNLVSGLQVFAFNQPGVRTLFGLAPLPRAPPFSMQQPPVGGVTAQAIPFAPGIAPPTPKNSQASKAVDAEK